MNSTILSRFSSGDMALIDPRRALHFENCLTELTAQPVARMEDEAMARAAVDEGFWPDPGSWLANYRPYVVRNGILHVPVRGVLLNNFPFQVGGFATGYTYILRAVERGVADDGVRGIALVCDSPGGVVSECFDVAEALYALRGTKPIRAYSHDSAYSAAYAIASTADSIHVSQTSGVGSIGVVTMHVDLSKAMSAAGIKITYIFAGKHKVDGNPYESLPKEVKERIQTRIDRMYGVFVRSVARNRDMSEDEVRATEALDYEGEEAVSVGLADSVSPFDAAIAAFLQDVETATGDEDMTTKIESPAPAAGTEAKVDESALAAARAEGAAAERARISAIMDSDEAKDRPVAARSIALNSGLSVEEAKRMLGSFVKETPVQAESAGKTASVTPLKRAMAGGGPGLSNLVPADDEADEAVASTPEARAAAILADHRTALGRKAPATK